MTTKGKGAGSAPAQPVDVETDPAPLDVDEDVELSEDLADENERLRGEVARLRAENEELRATGRGAGGRPAPRAPSFGVSEGERADLEAAAARRRAELDAGVPEGRATKVQTRSPFTGEQVTPADLPPGPRVQGTD
jgi:hypothetical protein